MTTSLESYGFDDVIVIVGPATIEGFFEGDDVVTIDRVVPSFTFTAGADGNTVANRSKNKNGTVKLKLMPQFSGHTYLSGLLLAMEGGVLPSVPVAVRDASTLLAIATSAHALLEKPPTAPLGEKVQMREWTLLLHDMVQLS